MVTLFQGAIILILAGILITLGQIENKLKKRKIKEEK